MKATRTALLTACALLCGCAPWAWRAKAHYPPTAGDVPTYSGPEAAALPPESYAIARAELEGRDLDALLPRLRSEAARAGAHAVIIDDLEAVTSTWNTTYTPRDRDAGEVARREEVEVSASSARVVATALRAPTACLGLSATCDGAAGDGGCLVRVASVLPDGPAFEAGLRPGNVVAAVDGAPIGHPWDLHRRVDAAPPGTEHSLSVDTDAGRQELPVSSRACVPGP
jgi:hypothetical protein